ncbi:WD40 repeat domain-containing protein [Streptomyces sp. ID05-39B]|uniref:WD40 repeat domain-containing protein n=1 Tax=Streptomyces sp. ID05-39B TaxID=3028664 RepID=UPI0029A64741|nr:WD40 repeat domain-containing protein [Streptomyces sp. ID05-39B]MDX3530620.1 WD40 repeat domain-containing protein [Streptomyces sp. ID05-39B]
MNVEELVRDSLRELAGEEASAGPGFTDRVLAVRRRRRTHRLVSVAAATAAVVAVSVAVPMLNEGRDDVRPASVTQGGGVSAHPDQSPPNDLIAAGRSALAAYYTTALVPRNKKEATIERTYWLLDPGTGTYKKDTRWSFVAVAPGLKTAAVLERTLPAARIGLLDLATGEVERWIPLVQGVAGLAFSNDGNKLVATTYSEHPEPLEKPRNAEESEGGWTSVHRVSRTGFLLLDLAGRGGDVWHRVPGSSAGGRADFAFTRDDKHLFAAGGGLVTLVRPKFYDLSGKETAAPANERHLRWDVPARLSPNGRLAALGLAEEYPPATAPEAGTLPGRSYSLIKDPLTGKEITRVRGAELLAWADDQRLIAWERTTGKDETYNDRLVLVTIGSDKVVPLSGVRELPETGQEPWEPVFAER